MENHLYSHKKKRKAISTASGKRKSQLHDFCGLNWKYPHVIANFSVKIEFVFSLRTILLSVISLLNEPNTFSPANVDASVMYRKWRDSKGKDREYVEIIR